MTRTGVRDSWARLVALGVVLLGAIGYVLGRALGGAELVNVRVTPGGRVIAFHDVRVWLLAALFAALAALLNWGMAVRRVALLGEALARERRERRVETDQRIERRLAPDEEDRLREELADARRGHADLLAAWRSERDWSRELRRQVAERRRAREPAGRYDDVPATVLQLTMALVEADKGMLLSGGGGAGERLEVVCSRGFATDPADGALARRFADPTAISGAKTTREDAGPGGTIREDAAPGAGVRNLLAIPVRVLDDVTGVIVCADRPGGFQELDEDVLLTVGEEAGAVLDAVSTRS